MTDKMSYTEKKKLEASIKEILEENRLWGQVWRMILGIVLSGCISFILAWPIAKMWNYTVFYMAGGYPMSFWRAFWFAYMVRLIWPISYKFRR